MKPENRKQLVRGVVTVKSKFGVEDLVAYTHWYRHDDNLSELEQELNSLVNCYSRMTKTSGMSYGYEYKDYRK